MVKYREACGEDFGSYSEAVGVLISFVETCKAIPFRLPPYTVQRLVDLAKRFLGVIAKFDIAKPKFHMLLHLAHRSQFQGNPWFYQCFLDEAWNKTLKKAVRNCSQSTFEASGLAKMEELTQHDAKRRR